MSGAVPESPAASPRPVRALSLRGPLLAVVGACVAVPALLSGGVWLLGRVQARLADPRLPARLVLTDLGAAGLEPLSGPLAEDGCDLDGDGTPDLFVRDVDGDGTPDLAFGDADHHRGARNVGLAWVASGRTGAVLLLVEGGADDAALGAAGSAAAGDSGSAAAGGPGDVVLGAAVELTGDLDGDGRADLLVGGHRRDAPRTGTLTAYSGASGAPLWTVSGVSARRDSLRAAGDLDGDGVEDAWVRERPGDAVLALSGRDGRTLYRAEPAGGDDFAGLATLADQNGDGVAELWHGRHGTSTVHDGATGAVLARLPHGRRAHWPAGDVDGDGALEVLHCALDHRAVLGLEVDRQMLCLADARGRRLGAAPWSGFHPFHPLPVPAGDVDGDGVTDLLVQDPDDRVLLVSGARLAGR